MSKKNLLKRILGIVLAASMVFNAAVIPVHAEPLDGELVNDATIEEVQQSDGEEDMLEVETETTDETEEDSEDKKQDSELIDDSETDVSELEVDSEENLFYRPLTEEEISVKSSVNRALEDFSDAESGEDYVENEFVMLCESEEEALKAAEAYETALGCEVALKRFQYGVATLIIKPVRGNNKSASYYLNSAMKIAADTNNNFPAISPNYYYHYDSVDTSGKEDYADPFLKNSDKHNQWYHDLIDDKYVWNRLRTDADYEKKVNEISVAVIDSGINYEHMDFDGAIKAHVSTAVEDDSEDDSNKGMDVHGHGSNVAGIIGSVAGNDVGGRGVAGGVGIVSVGASDGEGSLTTDAIVAAVNYVRTNKEEYNIRVTNMSIGSNYYTPLEAQVISEAYYEGILIVASAGNSNQYMCSYPASLPEVMSVASVTKNLSKSSFSNYGPNVDIAAPGGEGKVDGTKDGLWDSQLLWSEGFVGNYGYKDENDQYYVGMCGTSQASPVVAATAALIAAEHPEYTPAQLRSRLKATATPVKSSYGIGAGIVNVAAAVGVDAGIKPVVRNTAGEIIPNKGVLKNSDKIVLSVDNKDLNIINNGAIYYTLNGKNPDPEHMSETETEVYDGEPLAFDGSVANVTIKMKAYLYGEESAVTSYSYTFKQDVVSGVHLRINGIPYVEDDGSFSANDGVAVYSIAEGKKVNISATVTPASTKNKKLVWESSNSAVATVSASGQVTANAAGITTITAKSTDNLETPVFASIRIKVTPIARQISIKEDGDEIVLYRDGTTYNIGDHTAVYPLDAIQYATYTSSNTKVAEIDSNGVITALAKGTAVITATTTDGSALKDTITVRVINPVKSIKITEKDGAYFIAAGQEKQLSVIFNDGEYMPEDTSVSWSIADKDSEYASIDEDGVLHANDTDKVEPFTITVRAESADAPSVKYDEEDITVMPYATSELSSFKRYYNNMGIVDWYDLEDIYIDTCVVGQWYWIFEGDTEDKYTIEKDKNVYRYEFTASPNNSEKTFKYTSSNPSVLRIDERFDDDGNQYVVFTGLKAGYANITVKALDGTQESTVLKIKMVSQGGTYTNPTIYGKGEVNVLYPGKTLSFDVGNTGIYNKSSLELFTGDTREVGDKLYIDEIIDYPYVKCKGLTVTGTQELSKIGNEGNSRVKLFVGTKYYSYRDGKTYHDPLYCGSVGVELYPAGTTSVSLGEDTSKTLLVGKPYKLSPTSRPENACQKYYTYKSSKPSVATVSDDGIITAVGPGTADITVTAGDGSGKTAKCKVTVIKPVTELTISSKSGNVLGAGGSLQLTATVNKDASNKAVRWSLKNPADDKYVTVDASNGKVTALASIAEKADVVIVATAADDSGTSKEFTVTVCPMVKSMTADIKTMKLYSKTTGTLSNTGSFIVTAVSSASTPAYSTFKVTSSNEAVATATLENVGNGTARINITAHKKGSASIKVAALDGSKKSVTCSITVLEAVNSLEIAPDKGMTAIIPGKTVKLVATTNSSASNKKVDWKIESVSPEKYKDAFSLNTSKGTVTMDKLAVVDAADIVTLNISAVAQDGSGATESIDLYAYPASVSSIEIKEHTDNHVVTNETVCNGDSEGNLKNSLLCDIDVTGKNGGNTYNVVTVKSSKPKVASAVYNSADKTITVNGLTTGKSTITVSAADGSGVSKSFTVNVVAPVRYLSIASKTGYYAAAAGTSLQLKAFANADASNKKIEWKLTYDPEGTAEVPANIATISTSGQIKVAKPIGDPVKVYAKVTALDSSMCSMSRDIMLYPEQTGITVQSDKSSIKVGENVDVTIKGLNPSSCQDYMVTYKTGSGRVVYKSISTLSGTVVTVYGTKAGSVKITAKAQDGSGKSVSYTVYVTK